MESIKGRDKYNETQGGTFLSLSRIKKTRTKVLFLIVPVLIGIIASVFIITDSVQAAYITNPPNENMIQWKLDDDAANTTVAGSEVNGSLVGGNTEDVSSLLNGYPAFHLNGSSQYASITVPKIWPSARANLWTKYSGNPVISGLPSSVRFGQLVKNPSGGWYFYGSYLNDIYRWQSLDLISWTDQIKVLSAAAGAWDSELQVASVFQKPNGTWIMLYRGYAVATSYQIGLATSSDGTTFSRKDNGGVDDGLFPQFGSNYDPVGVMLVGNTYYVYVNGSPGHGVTNIYYSNDDFNTFTANPDNPVFPKGLHASNNESFCASVWKYGDYYYMLIARDIVLAGSDLYDHGIGLYRSTSPLFGADNTKFLGFVAVNDKSYDIRYLDTPSVPTTDVYRTTYAPEFGNTLYMIYDGMKAGSTSTQNLAYTTLDTIPSLKPRIDRLWSNISYSFWVQFDSLTDGDPVFSVGSSPTDASPVWLGNIKTSGADKVLALFLGGAYQKTSLPLAINTPYHIVITDNISEKKVYINGSLVSTFAQQVSSADQDYLYIGKGFGTRFLDGSAFDFRIYPDALSQTQVTKLYTSGSIDTTPPVTTDNIDGLWHSSNVTVNLTCTDTETGCAHTYYTTDGSTPTTSSSEGTSFTLTENGIYTVKYFSVDVVENVESVKTATNQVKIDKSSPNIYGPTVIFNDNSATVSWTTDEASTSRVDYGFTDNYASMTEDTNMVTEHHVGLTDLMPCHEYHYRVYSKDSSGNDRFSTDNTFTTQGCPAPRDTGSWRYFSGAYATSSSSTSSSTSSTSQAIPSTGTMDEAIRFDASNLFPGKSITKYLWDFGDGKTDEGRIVNHKYSSPNRYTIKVTGYDKDGNEYVYEQTIDINPEVPTIKNITSTNDTDLSIEGNGYKGDTIYLSIHSTPIELTSSVDDTGYWSYTITNASETLGEGEHTASAIDSFKLADNTELKSSPTDDTKFSVTVDNGKLKVEMEKSSRYKMFIYVLIGLIVAMVAVYLLRRRAHNS